MICWKCGKEYEGEIHRTTTCECGADLHCCYNCKFYSEGSHYDCSETVDDIVVNKDKSNFCDFFRAGKNSKKSSVGTGTGDDAKAAAEALFGGESVNQTKSGADAFNSLFGGL